MPLPSPKTGIKGLTKKVVFAPDTKEVKDIANRFQHMGYFNSFFPFISVEFKKNESEMIEFLKSQKNISNPLDFSIYLCGVSLQFINKTKGMQFEYKLHFDDELRPAINVSKLKKHFNLTSNEALFIKIIEDADKIDFQNDTSLLKTVIAKKG